MLKRKWLLWCQLALLAAAAVASRSCSMASLKARSASAVTLSPWPLGAAAVTVFQRVHCTRSAVSDHCVQLSVAFRCCCSSRSKLCLGTEFCCCCSSRSKLCLGTKFRRCCSARICASASSPD